MDAGRESADAGRTAQQLLWTWVHRAGPPAAVPWSEGASAVPTISFVSVRPTRSSGAQIFNYLLLLHLDHGSPDCVQKYLPP